MPRSIRSFLPVVCLVSLVSVGALLRSARADEPDAETRFHDAYVLEVIDGKVADAAKAYLALVEDERTPPRIEGEARFRFAVCAALLGRPDESRARLASLVADPATSPDLQTRARTYLDALQGQEVGSELEKKLQSLVFDLARAPLAGPDAVPPVYRDFEVLGDKAVPFLRGLLHHPDVTLRAHAFRLLCRMREPGMGAAWTPEIGVGSRGSWFGIDVTSYLNAQPNEKEAFEKNLLGRSDSEDASALRVLAGRADFHFSRETVRALAAREGVKELAPALLASPMGDGADLIRTWLEGDDPVLATAAAEQVYAAARNGAAKGPLPAPLPEVLAPVFREGWSHAYPTRETLGWLASAAPTSEVLDALAALLQAARSWSRPANTNPLYAYWGTSLQAAFGDRDLTPKELARWEDLALETFVATRALFPEAGTPGNSAAYLDPFRALLQKLPARDAEAFVHRVLAGPLADRESHWLEGLARAIPTDTPGQLRLFLTALNDLSPGDRVPFVRMLGQIAGAQSLRPEVQAELIRMAPEVVPLSNTDVAALVSRIPWLSPSASLSDAERKDLVGRLLLAIDRFPSSSLPPGPAPEAAGERVAGLGARRPPPGRRGGVGPARKHVPRGHPRLGAGRPQGRRPRHRGPGTAPRGGGRVRDGAPGRPQPGGVAERGVPSRPVSPGVVAAGRAGGRARRLLPAADPAGGAAGRDREEALRGSREPAQPDRPEVRGGLREP